MRYNEAKTEKVLMQRKWEVKYQRVWQSLTDWNGSTPKFKSAQSSPLLSSEVEKLFIRPVWMRADHCSYGFSILVNNFCTTFGTCANRACTSFSFEPHTATPLLAHSLSFADPIPAIELIDVIAEVHWKSWFFIELDKRSIDILCSKNLLKKNDALSRLNIASRLPIAAPLDSILSRLEATTYS